MAWAICGGPHAFLYLQTIRRLPQPRHYLPSPLHALAFTLALTATFYTLSHTIPCITRFCNNVLSTLTTSFSSHHTSCTYSLAGPKPKIWRHLFFCFWPTTAQTQIPWALAPGARVWGAPSCTAYFLFVWGPWSLLTLTNFQGTSAYTRRRGTCGRSVGLP